MPRTAEAQAFLAAHGGTGLAPLAGAIGDVLQQKGRCVVGLDGMAAAGKTTAAALLCRAFGGACVHMDDFFLRFHLSVVPDIELSTTDLIVPVTEHNLGIGFVPEPFAAGALCAGSVFSIRLTEAVPPRQICLVYRTDLPLSIAAQAFLELLTDDPPAVLE